MIKTALWPLTVIAGFTLGAFAGIADEKHVAALAASDAAKEQSHKIIAVTTIRQCGKAKVLVVSKGDGSQWVMAPVIPNVANALYAQVPKGAAMTLELPCFVST